MLNWLQTYGQLRVNFSCPGFQRIDKRKVCQFTLGTLLSGAGVGRALRSKESDNGFILYLGGAGGF